MLEGALTKTREQAAGRANWRESYPVKSLTVKLNRARSPQGVTEQCDANHQGTVMGEISAELDWGARFGPNQPSLESRGHVHLPQYLALSPSGWGGAERAPEQAEEGKIWL
jgi:hypothetical protein